MNEAIRVLKAEIEADRQTIARLYENLSVI